MDEAESEGVQHDSRSRVAGEIFEFLVLTVAIGAITGEGIAEKLEMDANLVRASGM